MPTILLVDDNLANLSVLMDTLRDDGHRLIIAQSGEGALERLQHVTPDLILLDIMMPGMDGYETMRRLQANKDTLGIPVIFLTILDDTDAEIKGLEMGAVDYLTKPIQVPVAKTRIHTQLIIAQMRAELQAYNETLEEKVAERTAELTAEISRRRRNEAEKERLLIIAQQQSMQLRHLIGQLTQSQDEEILNINKELHSHILTNLDLLNLQLSDLFEKAPISGILMGNLQQALKTVMQIKVDTEQISSKLSTLSSSDAERQTKLNSLSPQERRVLQLVIEGQTNQEIAQTLKIGRSSVGTYRNRVMQKLGVSNLPDLIKFAIKTNLISLD